MTVNEQVAIDHGLKKDEYKKICDLLKRTPNITELAIFSAMWNEHCSYKSSRKHLKNLHTCLLYTSPSPRDTERSRMPSSA